MDHLSLRLQRGQRIGQYREARIDQMQFRRVLDQATVIEDVVRSAVRWNETHFRQKFIIEKEISVHVFVNEGIRFAERFDLARCVAFDIKSIPPLLERHACNAVKLLIPFFRVERTVGEHPKPQGLDAAFRRNTKKSVHLLVICHREEGWGWLQIAQHELHGRQILNLAGDQKIMRFREVSEDGIGDNHIAKSLMILDENGWWNRFHHYLLNVSAIDSVRFGVNLGDDFVEVRLNSCLFGFVLHRAFYYLRVLLAD